MFADGFDDSILGYDTKGRVVYSVDSILETLTERDGMSVDEAREYFYFNIDGAYVGEYTQFTFINYEKIYEVEMSSTTYRTFEIFADSLKMHKI